MHAEPSITTLMAEVIAPVAGGPVFETERVKLYQGHALQTLRGLPEASVDMVVTSPPYWGLRSYGTESQIWGGDAACEHEWQVRSRPGMTGGTASELVHDKGLENFQAFAATEYGTCLRCGAWRGELGLEPTPELYVEHLSAVAAEVRRVLKPWGTFWLNIADSYATYRDGKYIEQSLDGKQHDLPREGAPSRMREAFVQSGLKSKDMTGIPWRTAFALQKQGWWLRSDVIWVKENPMPESVLDRPTRTHEHIFLFAKSEVYFYDSIAVAEPSVVDAENAQRNRRDVWTFSTAGYGGKHLAVFPQELPSICIQAGTSEKGNCADCGQPYERLVGRICPQCRELVAAQANECTECGYRNTEWQGEREVNSVLRADDFAQSGRRVPRRPDLTPKRVVADWIPHAHCSGKTVRPVVMDIFAGSGTTLAVAKALGRNSIGIELNKEYLPLIEERLMQEALW